MSEMIDSLAVGDDCPRCDRGRLSMTRPRQAHRLICPRCCAAFY